MPARVCIRALLLSIFHVKYRMQINIKYLTRVIIYYLKLELYIYVCVLLMMALKCKAHMNI